MADTADSIPLVVSGAAGLVLAALACIVGLPLVALLWHGAPWRVFGWGAVVFLVFQPGSASPGRSRSRAGRTHIRRGRRPSSSSPRSPQGCSRRWVAGWATTVLRRDQNARAGVMCGLGQGGVEAMLLVGLSLASA